MNSMKTILAAMLTAMAGTAGAQVTNYVHIIKSDGTEVEYSQMGIKSMTIDTKHSTAFYVEFTDGEDRVQFATMNLGATSVADGTSSYGNYYAWGATEPFGTVTYSSLTSGTMTPKYKGGYIVSNAPYFVSAPRRRLHQVQRHGAGHTRSDGRCRRCKRKDRWLANTYGRRLQDPLRCLRQTNHRDVHVPH